MKFGINPSDGEVGLKVNAPPNSKFLGTGAIHHFLLLYLHLRLQHSSMTQKQKQDKQFMKLRERMKLS